MLDDLPVAELGRFEQELYQFVEAKHPAVLTDILAKKVLDDDLKGRAKAAIEAFKKKFVHDGSAAPEAEEADDEAEEAPKPKAKTAKKGK